MLSILDPLRELSFISIMVRLFLAMIFGGSLGINGNKKRRAAGFRTYAIVCLGAALAVILGQYEFVLIHEKWAAISDFIGIKTDVSRFGAQVINGIGFLATGTVIVTGKNEVKGLTTAAGLWASACAGLAIGAGFYEWVIVTFVSIMLTLYILRPIEERFLINTRNMNIYVEFRSVNDIGTIISCIKSLGVQIFYVDMDYADNRIAMHPSASIALRLPKGVDHTSLLSEVSSLKDIYNIYEN